MIIETVYGRSVEAPQRRQAWNVRIVYNTWTVVKELFSLKEKFYEQLFAHCGVAFKDAYDPTAQWRVYSMDFENELRKTLVLQMVWHTDGGGWQQIVYGHEFSEVIRPNDRSDAVLYFSEAEFAVTAQVIMDYFLDDPMVKDLLKSSRKLSTLQRTMHKQRIKYIESASWDAGNGALYSLPSPNCQDYAEYLFDALLHQGWHDKRRLNEYWYPMDWLNSHDDLFWMEVLKSKKWKCVHQLMEKPVEYTTKLLLTCMVIAGVCKYVSRHSDRRIS